jgi:AhpD family alkylhydroperoxidase
MADTVQHLRTPEAFVPDSKPGPRARKVREHLRRAIFTGGALDGKTKQLIAVGAAHLTQCRWCIDGHIDLANRLGATPDEITETMWVAAEIRAGGTFPHPVLGPHAHLSSAPPCRSRDEGSK